MKWVLLFFAGEVIEAEKYVIVVVTSDTWVAKFYGQSLVLILFRY